MTEINIEKTLVILKPDAIEDGLAGKILSRIEEQGFRLVDVLMRPLTREECQSLYPKTRLNLPPIYQKVEEFMTGNPSIICLIKGPCAIERIFALRGPTNLLQAPIGTIRRDFITDRQRELFRQGKNVKNLMHAPEDTKEALEQINIFFSDNC